MVLISRGKETHLDMLPEVAHGYLCLKWQRKWLDDQAYFLIPGPVE